MRRYGPLAILIIIVIVAVIGIAIAHNNSSSNNTTSSNSASNSAMNMPANSTSPTTAQPSASDKVSIANFAFSPANITVKKGTSVTWTNNDSTTHTVTGDTSGGPNSGSLAPGKSYSFSFNQSGTFNYHCSIHPTMTGSVTVTE